jgi:glutamine synthetase
MTASSHDLVAFLYTDISGVTRGRAVPASDLRARLDSGVGWVPANQALTSLGPIADPNPWGALGDLRLSPDPSTETRVDLWPGTSPLHFFLCDATTVDGRPWDCCPRVLLRQAMEALEQETGTRLVASFEHEFHLSQPAGRDDPAPPPFSLEALRGSEPFPRQLMLAADQAGLQVETFLPEYGQGQFELTCPATDGVAAADRAVIVRAVVKEVARNAGRRASFSPGASAGQPGNGVHVHFSFRDADGKVAGHDDRQPGGLDALSGGFAAGVLAHLPALCGFTAPSPVSYLRLGPHNWSAGYSIVGKQNREAALRLPPVAKSEQFNLEYRAADATASPYLALAVLVLAGLDGIKRGLNPPPVLDEDPESLGEAERAAHGVKALPGSLGEALSAIEADPVVGSWLSPELLEAYLAMKRFELAMVEELEPEELCSRYVDVY